MDLNPAWLASIDKDLVDVASQERQGRRWLAQSLPSGFLVIDRVPAEWGDDELVASRRWLLSPLRVDPRLVRLAGAIRSLPWIRRQLHRETVLTIDRVVGRELYSMLLAIREDWTLNARDSERMNEAAGSEDAFATFLDELGRQELLGYANGLHVAVADRFRLAFGPGVEAIGDGSTAVTAIDTVAAGMNWEQAA